MVRNKSGFVLVLVVVVVLSFFVVKPMVDIVLAALVLAYLFHPLFRKIDERIMKRGLSALITTFFAVFMIIVPAVVVANALTQEVIHIVASSDQPECRRMLVCTAFNYLKNVNPELPDSIQSTAASIISAFKRYVEEQASSIFISLSSTVFQFTILVFILYYLLKDGSEISKKAMDLLPLGQSHKIELVGRVDSAANAILFGHFVVAVVQGLVSFAWFVVFGVANPVLWGLVAFFASLFPIIGAFAVWMPASIIMMGDGYLQSSNFLIVKGIGLFAYGTLIISMVDNFLRPKLIGDKANVHPLIVLIGIVGGISVFGLVGVVIGPLILALLSIMVEMAEKDGVV